MATIATSATRRPTKYLASRPTAWKESTGAAAASSAADMGRARAKSRRETTGDTLTVVGDRAGRSHPHFPVDVRRLTANPAPQRSSLVSFDELRAGHPSTHGGATSRVRAR